MVPNLENMVDVVRRYVQVVPVSVLLVYCCAVSHCHGATDPGVPIVLGAVATRLTGCPPCPLYLVMCFIEVIW